MSHPIEVPNTIPWCPDQSHWILKDLSSTIQFGELLVTSLENTNIVLLEGPLGAGKTSLVKGIAKGLLIQDSITSPTFALSHHYQNGNRALFHLDLYRLEQHLAANELFLEEEETSQQCNGLLVIEWPSRLTIEITEACLIKLDYLPEIGRSIQVNLSEKDSKKLSTAS